MNHIYHFPILISFNQYNHLINVKCDTTECMFNLPILHVCRSRLSLLFVINMIKTHVELINDTLLVELVTIDTFLQIYFQITSDATPNKISALQSTLVVDILLSISLLPIIDSIFGYNFTAMWQTRPNYEEKIKDQWNVGLISGADKAGISTKRLCKLKRFIVARPSIEPLGCLANM